MREGCTKGQAEYTELGGLDGARRAALASNGSRVPEVPEAFQCLL